MKKKDLSKTRRQKDCLYGTFYKRMERNSKIEEMVEKMDVFCRTKKHVPDDWRGYCGCFARISATPRGFRISGVGSD